MKHFLARLVDRVRGTAARVEPVVAPRFAPTPIVEIASEIETLPPERRDQQPTVEQSLSPRPVVQQQAPAGKIEAKTFREPQESSSPQRSEKLLVPMEKSAVDSTPFVRRTVTADRPVQAIANRIVRRNSFISSRPKRPRPATSLSTKSVNLERDLLTPNESSEEAPIVHVTIGRIDVRATSEAAPPRKSSTRFEPKLTLDAYLKSRRESAR